jgi:hypothetical protein
MAVTINADNGVVSGSAGLKSSADSTGILALQTNGITAVTVDENQRAAFVAGTSALPAITTTGDTNTGIFFPSADTIAFSEGGAEAMRIDSSGNLLFNSGYGSVATAYGCRAWVNFNGTGTIAIRASANVTSLTDNGTGDYTVNLTTAMPDANYAICGNVGNTTNSDKVMIPTNLAAPTTSAFRISSQTYLGANNDNNYIWAAIFR